MARCSVARSHMQGRNFDVKNGVQNFTQKHPFGLSKGLHRLTIGYIKLILLYKFLFSF